MDSRKLRVRSLALGSVRPFMNAGITEVQVSGGPGEEDILSDLPEAKERMHFAESAGELGIKG